MPLSKRWIFLLGSGVAGYIWWRLTSPRPVAVRNRAKSGERSEGRPLETEVRDKVDQASWESFPASDSPSWH